MAAVSAVPAPTRQQTLEPFVETPPRAAGPLPLPFAARLSHGSCAAGRALTVRGVVASAAKRFGINLLNGVASDELAATIPRQVPLHLCFHFDVGIVVLDSYLDGAWGYEECHQNTLAAGAPFEVAIEVHDGGFEVKANGKRVATYPHRVCPEAVDYMQVRGDLQQLDSVEWGSNKEATGAQ